MEDLKEELRKKEELIEDIVLQNNEQEKHYKEIIEQKEKELNDLKKKLVICFL